MEKIKNVLVLQGTDFSDAGLGKIENTVVAYSISSTYGFIANGGAVTTNSTWGARVNLSDLINIPSGASRILGVTNLFSASGSDFLPCVCWYDSNGDALGSSVNVFELNPTIKESAGTITSSSTSMKVKKGYLNAKIPSGAAKARIQWFFMPKGITGIDDSALIDKNGPSLVWE